ncbi:MAG: hypothetical protein ABSG70_11195 [Terriglobales bacterium]
MERRHGSGIILIKTGGYIHRKRPVRRRFPATGFDMGGSAR